MVSKPKTTKEVVEDYFDDCSLIHKDLNNITKPPNVGRPQYVPSDNHYQIVRALCLFGAPHTYIATYVGIAPKTLRKYYPELLKDCKENKNFAVQSSLFVQALRGNVEAIKYWLDNHMKEQYNKLPPSSAGEDLNATELLAGISRVLNANR